MPTTAEKVTTSEQAAKAVVSAAESGGGVRASMAGLAWAGMSPFSLAAHCAHTTTDRSTFTLLAYEPSPTPATIVAEGDPKPEAILSARKELPLVKHAGYVEATLEQLLWAPSAEQVLSNVLVKQAVASLDKAIVAALDTTNTPVTATGSASQRILAAHAELLGLGSVPGAIAVSPADYAAIVGAETNSGYLNLERPEEGFPGRLFGLGLVPTPAVVEGTAFVFDPSGVVVAEQAESPMLFVSPMSVSNTLTVIVDLIAATGIASSTAVAKVALTTA